MSKLPFVCLNVEPESEDDEEIDNTAEIKLEEALKLYQQALKLHAHGPSAFAEAQDAYDELFENEIFTYSEALSFRKRQEALDAETTDSENESESESDSEPGLDQPSLDDLTPTATEGGPSTLRQVVYLSYKNYGQFQLDRLQHDLVGKGLADESLDQIEPTLLKRMFIRARKALESFADALDKDDTDVDLWRQVARLTALLGSQRMTRFCLETVLATNEEDGGVASDDLVMSVVRGDLEEVYGQIVDDVAGNELRTTSGKKPVPPRVKRILDPCPSIPKPSKLNSSASLPPREAKVLRLKSQSWVTLGKHILKQFKSGAPQGGTFANMCVGFRIETASDTAIKHEGAKGKRRRTIDSVENYRSGHEPAEEADTTMGGIDGPLSPAPMPSSPVLQKGFPGDDTACSPTQEQTLPMRGLSSEDVRQEPEELQKLSVSPLQERSGSLKRSPEAAGLAQEPPEARSRSKRLRARETGADDDATKDQRQQLEKQLKPLEDADRHLFGVCETLLKRMSVTAISGWESLRSPVLGSGSDSKGQGTDDLAVAFRDLKTSLETWNSNKSSLLLHGTGAGATATLISKGNEAGLANFLEHAKSGPQATRDIKPLLHDQDLEAFIGFVNQSWLSVDELAVSWLINIMGPRISTSPVSEGETLPKYLTCTWSTELKSLIHDILSYADDFAFKKLDDAILSWTATEGDETKNGQNSLESLMEFIQTIFEVQLDTYDSMIKPTSKVDQPTRILQRARLQRWAFLGSQAIAKRNGVSRDENSTDLTALRHLFSMTLYLSLDEESGREHIIQCLQEVKERVKDGECETVTLPNIDIMPEISSEAIEQEISRLTTTDFFMSVFNPSDDDPVATIESLEPIILPLSLGTHVSQRTCSQPPEANCNGDDAAASPSGQLTIHAQSPAPPDPQKDQLLEFLSKSTASLRLSLWNRLTNAYSAIDAPPFVFLCTIHSMNLVLSELRTPAYTMQPENTRMSNLLIWTRNLIDLTDKCCGLINSEPTALACMDDDNLRLALNNIASCVRLFHLFALWDDRIRLGQTGPPTQQAGGANAFRQAMNMLRDMQVKIWRLLYTLLREAASQNSELFPDLHDDFLVYISAAHSAIGLREYCKLGKKTFLKFVKSELLALKPENLDEWRYQMAQVAYDLYDLRVLADSNTWMTLQEHNCSADQLDRATAKEILPMVMAQVQGISVRDIIKPDRRDFKQTIDKIQDLIGSPKASTVQQSFNRKQLLTLQKRAIRGSDLMNAMKGIGGLTNMPVKNDFTEIAKTGWYFVVGYLRLASFRSVKRTGPDSTKELVEAMDFLKFDIDYDCEKWETWYRLAQAYDSMLDEEVTWTADRINHKMEDLVTLQRQAIHCYSTAVALAARLTDGVENSKTQSQETILTLSELYSDFGKRLYASSRPPFDMNAFSVKDHARWYFTHSQVKFRKEPFKPMSKAAVWLVSSVLFRQALSFRDSDWHSWYMLGKCNWKLLGDEDVGGLSHEQVLHAFGKACEVAPLKDGKHPEKGLILEPHAKLVSVVHKLVYHRGLLNPLEGAEWLRKSPYSEKATLKDPSGKQEWLDYARHVIRNLHTADKANWHHRIMARAAKMAFEDPSQESPAEAAIMQLTPHIFTKTMVVQVWRTVFERAGRHFVYTTRYVNFFIELLRMTGDRTSLEALGRKVRKKQAEFIDHLSIWTRICKEHVALLRGQESVPPTHEETVLFVLPYETFVPNAALLQTWAQPANADPPAHPLLSVLREAIDLKKLNLNLIPNQGIDDLIGDAYAKLYEEMVPGLVANATNEKNREAMRVDRILMGDPGPDERGDSGTGSAVPLTNPSGRAKIVGRMEVRRRAEALVQRLAASQVPVKGKVAALAEAVTAQEEADESEANAGASPDANNDADDESELSELDDEPLEQLHDEAEGAEGADDEENGEADDVDDGDDVHEEVADGDVDMDAASNISETLEEMDHGDDASKASDEHDYRAEVEDVTGNGEATNQVEIQ